MIDVHHTKPLHPFQLGEGMLHIELSSAQIVGYLMVKSLRQLPDAPSVDLPYAIAQDRP
ncbi:hypothetical protein [Pseudomonas sp. KCJK8993]|uniref:hypothetical protein n=1 Tax=Pseudomonas sp. KCJK8993 TaxID=3344565 RepID=UPI003906A573